MKKLYGLLLAMTLLLGACNSASKTAEDTMRLNAPEGTQSATMGEISMEYDGVREESGGGAAPGEAAMSGQYTPDAARKLIRTARYTMETMDYDDTLEQLEGLITRFHGYIESSAAAGAGVLEQSYPMNRHAYYTIRIPTESFFDFGKELASCGSITESNQSAQEVTDYYYDTEARLTTLRVQEERLLTLMSQATELEAIIQLEGTLADIRYQIESHEGTLRRLDSQVAYSTIELNVYEVFEPTVTQPAPRNLGDRVSQRFQSSWQGLVRQGENFIVWFAGGILNILLTLAVLAIAFFVIRYSYRRYTKKQSGKRKALDKNVPTDEDPSEEEINLDNKR